MNDMTYPIVGGPRELQEPSDPVWITFILSVLVHVLALLLMVAMPRLAEKEPYIVSPESVISVSMVTLEVAQPGAEAVAESAPVDDGPPLVTAEDFEMLAQPPEPAPEPEAAVPTEDDLIAQADVPVIAEPEPVEEAPEPSPQTAAPSPPPADAVPELKVEKSPPEVKQIKPKLAVKKPEKVKAEVVKPEEVKPASIKSAIEDLRRKQARKEARVARAASGNGERRPGPIGGVFLSQVRTLVERNWTASPQLLEIRDDLQAIISVTIDPEGYILDAYLKQSSNNRYLDDSALRAVRKVVRFPPIPPGYSGNQTLVFRFTPKGLN